MPLILSDERPPFIPVKLGRDAFIRLRAATSDEYDDAAAEVGSMIAGALAGGESAAAIAQLAPDFDLGDLADLLAIAKSGGAGATLAAFGVRDKLASLSERLVLIELVSLCTDGWSGLVDKNKQALAAPDRGSIMLLLRDVTIRRKCKEVVFSAVHAEQDEGNAYAGSPNGGGPADEKSAQTADPSAPPVPAAVAASIPASDAPK